MAVRAKICGISSRPALFAALEGGADYVGFVFFGGSPRNIALSNAAILRALVPKTVRAVAVMVDPADAFLGDLVQVLKPNLLQLHGSESPARTAAIRRDHGVPVMKAIGLADAADLEAAERYATAADLLLFDAKRATGEGRPGGNARAFDWTLLKDRTIRIPWFLSGGLHARNVSEAVRSAGACLVDVSSGVERAAGEKDPALIREFLDVVRVL